MVVDSEAVLLEKIKSATEIVKNIRDSKHKSVLELRAEEFLRDVYAGGVTTACCDKSDNDEVQKAAELGFSGLLKGE